MRCAKAYVPVLMVAAGLLAACSANKPYERSGPENLTIHTASDKAKVSLDIFAVDADCEADYLGTLALDNGTTSISLPVGTTFVAANFQTFRLTSPTNIVTQETLLDLGPDGAMLARLSYRNSMYDAEFVRLHPDGEREPVPLRPFAACAEADGV